MKTFKNTKQAISEVNKLLQELEIKTFDTRIEQFTSNSKAYFIDIDISGISLYDMQRISELLNDGNPVITPTTNNTITIGSVFKIQ